MEENKLDTVNEPQAEYGMYSYADYLTWRFEERVELIKGWLHKMSPAPRRIHQKIEGVIFYKFFSFLEDKACEVYQSPFDVRLAKNKGKNYD